MKKRILAMLLTLSMLASMMVTGVSAEDAVDVDEAYSVEEQAGATQDVPAVRVDEEGNAIVPVDDDGNVIAPVDEDGNITPPVDEDGNVLPAMDEDGNVIPREDNEDIATDSEEFQEIAMLMTTSADAGTVLTADSSELTTGTYVVPDGGLIIANALSIAATETVVINLNGQDLIHNSTVTTAIANNGNLTITDSVGGGSYTINETYSSEARGIYCYLGSSLTLQAGTLTVNSDGTATTNAIYATGATTSVTIADDAMLKVTNSGSTIARGVYLASSASINVSGAITATGGTSTTAGICRQNLSY